MPYTSLPLPLPPDANGVPFTRADLRFIDVAHGGESFEGRIFLNNPEASLRTPTTIEAGYAGSLYVFGHPHCWGDDGHCMVTPGPLHGFDDRYPHHLVPQLHEVDVTDAIRALIARGTTEITVTVLPVIRRAGRRRLDDTQLRFVQLELASYD
jgi:hypothetical protein